MKKQIAFCIIWDIFFIGQMYVFSNINIMLKKYARDTLETGNLLWFQLLWMIIVGGIISILVTRGSKYQTNKKSAIIEMLIIGIPALYIATIIVIPFNLTNFLWGNFSYLSPLWIYRDSVPMIIGGILLGYEICIFITRMFESGKDKTKTDPGEPFNDA